MARHGSRENLFNVLPENLDEDSWTTVKKAVTKKRQEKKLQKEVGGTAAGAMPGSLSGHATSAPSRSSTGDGGMYSDRPAERAASRSASSRIQQMTGPRTGSSAASIPTASQREFVRSKLQQAARQNGMAPTMFLGSTIEQQLCAMSPELSRKAVQTIADKDLRRIKLPASELRCNILLTQRPGLPSAASGLAANQNMASVSMRLRALEKANSLPPDQLVDSPLLLRISKMSPKQQDEVFDSADLLNLRPENVRNAVGFLMARVTNIERSPGTGTVAITGRLRALEKANSLPPDQLVDSPLLQRISSMPPKQRDEVLDSADLLDLRPENVRNAVGFLMKLVTNIDRNPGNGTVAAARPQLPGRPLPRAEIAAKLQQLLRSQGIKDARPFKLPLLEDHMATLPAAATQEALHALAQRDLKTVWHPASFMLNVITNTEQTWKFRNTTDADDSAERRHWEELKRRLGDLCRSCAVAHDVVEDPAVLGRLMKLTPAQVSAVLKHASVSLPAADDPKSWLMALISRAHTGELTCENCKQPGHYAGNCPKVVGDGCGQAGHIERLCPRRADDALNKSAAPGSRRSSSREYAPEASNDPVILRDCPVLHGGPPSLSSGYTSPKHATDGTPLSQASGAGTLDFGRVDSWVPLPGEVAAGTVAPLGLLPGLREHDDEDTCSSGDQSDGGTFTTSVPRAEAAGDVAANDLAADVAAAPHAKRSADLQLDIAAGAASDEPTAYWQQLAVEMPAAGDASVEWQQAAAAAAEPAGSAAAREQHAADVASAVAAVVQCLWLCTGVRPALQQWETSPDDTPIVQALVQLAKVSDAAAADDVGSAGHETAAGSPQQQTLQLLQAAVADCLPPSEFGVGCPEVLLVLYEQLSAAAGPPGLGQTPRGQPGRAALGWQVLQELSCGACAAAGAAHPVAFEQLFFNVGAASLLRASADQADDGTFADVLHAAEADAPWLCTACGSDGAKPRRSPNILDGTAPEALIVQVTQTGGCGRDALAELWAAIDTTIEAGTMFLGADHKGALRYRLTAAVCQALPAAGSPSGGSHIDGGADTSAASTVGSAAASYAAAVLAPGSDGKWGLGSCGVGIGGSTGDSGSRAGGESNSSGCGSGGKGLFDQQQRFGASWKSAAARVSGMGLAPHLLWFVRA